MGRRGTGNGMIEIGPGVSDEVRFALLSELYGRQADVEVWHPMQPKLLHLGSLVGVAECPVVLITNNEGASNLVPASYTFKEYPGHGTSDFLAELTALARKDPAEMDTTGLVTLLSQIRIRVGDGACRRGFVQWAATRDRTLRVRAAYRETDPAGAPQTIRIPA